jgi:hypothetical protein
VKRTCIGKFPDLHAVGLEPFDEGLEGCDVDGCVRAWVEHRVTHDFEDVGRFLVEESVCDVEGLRGVVFGYGRLKYTSQDSE